MTTTNTSSVPLIIYHHPCFDGTAAAWVAWEFFKKQGGCELYPTNYGKEAPLNICVDREVYILDFSYCKDEMDLICQVASHVTVIDHHKTTQQELSKYTGEELANKNLTLVFNMEKAGCILTWEFFYSLPYYPPALLDLIADRDLWKFKHPATKAVLAGLGSYPFDVEEYDKLIYDVEGLEQEGQALLRAQALRIEQTLKNVRRVNLLGSWIPCVNCPPDLASEVGNRLCEQYDSHSLTYFDLTKVRKYSLRSLDSLADVSAIAQQLGGGGHRNAAGFTAPLPKEII